MSYRNLKILFRAALLLLPLSLNTAYAQDGGTARPTLQFGAVPAPILTPRAGNVVDFGGGAIIPNRYIVVFKDTVTNPASVANELAATQGLGRGQVFTHALKGFAVSMSADRLNVLARDPRIQSIEPDQVVRVYGQTTPTGIRRIFAADNPNITINGTDDKRIDVDVAVIDTGIDYTHPDLNVAGQQTDCTSATCVDGPAMDGYGHGTHVAGTIGALDNDFGVVGVAPGARLWNVKVLDDTGSGTMSGVIAGVDWVTAHASQIKVANMSLGGGSSSALCSAIHASVGAGVTYVVAAGNSHQDAYYFSPANCADAIAVSALADYNGQAGGGASASCGYYGSDDTLASFSNYSRIVPLIAAPGVCIRSTYKGGTYALMSGTSMASPHVAGAAALLRASGVAAGDIRATLNATGNLNWTDTSGDRVQERLLDVHDTSVYQPATVATSSGGGGGSGGGGDTQPPPPPPADTTAPTATIQSPGNGSAVSGNVLVRINASDDVTPAGSLTVTWTVDSETTTRSAAYNSGTGKYEATWDTTTATNASHTISVRATDQANNSTNATPVGVTVSNAPPVIAATFGLLNGQMVCTTSSYAIYFKLTMVNDLNAAVPGVALSTTLRNTTAGGVWNASGTTGSDGSLTLRLVFPKRGTYELTINDATFSGLQWDGVSPTNTCTK